MRKPDTVVKLESVQDCTLKAHLSLSSFMRRAATLAKSQELGKDEVKMRE